MLSLKTGAKSFRFNAVLDETTKQSDVFNCCGVHVRIIAKFNIFSVVIEKKLYGIAIVAAINSVIALYYYVKLAKTMIFGQADGEVKVAGFTPMNQAVIIGLFIPVLFLGIFWEKVMVISGNAVIYIK